MENRDRDRIWIPFKILSLDKSSEVVSALCRLPSPF